MSEKTIALARTVILFLLTHVSISHADTLVFQNATGYPTGTYDLDVAARDDASNDRRLLVGFSLRQGDQASPGSSTEIRLYESMADFSRPTLLYQRSSSAVEYTLRSVTSVAGTESWVALLQLRSGGKLRHNLWRLETVEGLVKEDVIEFAIEDAAKRYDQLSASGKQNEGHHFLVVGRRTAFDPDAKQVESAIVAWLFESGSREGPFEVPEEVVLISQWNEGGNIFDEVTVNPLSYDENDGWLVAFKRASEIAVIYVNPDGSPVPFETMLPFVRNTIYDDVRVAGMLAHDFAVPRTGSTRAPPANRRYLMAWTQRSQQSDVDRELWVSRFDWRSGRPLSIAARELGTTAGDLDLSYDSNSQSHWLLSDKTFNRNGTGDRTPWGRSRFSRLGHSGAVVQQFTEELGATWPLERATTFDRGNDRFAIVRTRSAPEMGVYGRDLRHSSLTRAYDAGQRCNSGRLYIQAGAILPYPGQEFFDVFLRGAPANKDVLLNISPRLKPKAKILDPCRPILDMDHPDAKSVRLTTNSSGLAQNQFALSDRDLWGPPGSPTNISNLDYDRALHMQWSWAPGSPLEIDPATGQTRPYDASNALTLIIEP